MFFSQYWEPAVKLINKRAYAASVVLPDGRMWILGGAGTSAVLDTTEFVWVYKFLNQLNHFSKTTTICKYNSNNVYQLLEGCRRFQ